MQGQTRLFTSVRDWKSPPRNMELRRLLIIFFLLSTAQSQDQQPEERFASACYGTTDNFLELSCEPWEVIHVQEVLYGAKKKASNCPNPTVDTHHAPECCMLEGDDCTFSLPGTQSDPIMTRCINETKCRVRTRWFDTRGHCDDTYLANTNFMHIAYICVTNSSSSAAITRKKSLTTTTTKTTTRKTTSTVTTVKGSNSPTTRTEQSTPHVTTNNPLSVVPRSWLNLSNTGSQDSPPTSTAPTPGMHVEVDVSFTTRRSTYRTPTSGSTFAFTTGMMGGMTAAIIGLMLTIFGFLFYWGRRRRKLLTTKPNSSTVWDFLLSHTVAARTFRRGYDNFSNNRESISSEGDAPSPGKPTWLPNIRVEPNFDTHSVTSDDNCSIVNINATGTVSSHSDRSEA